MSNETRTTEAEENWRRLYAKEHGQRAVLEGVLEWMTPINRHSHGILVFDLVRDFTIKNLKVLGKTKRWQSVVFPKAVFGRERGDVEGPLEEWYDNWEKIQKAGK